MMGYLDKGMKELHELLVMKKITPLDLAKEAVERAKADSCNSFEKVLEQEALDEAARLTEPEEDNILWGLPYIAKDNFSTKGTETTASSNVLKGYVPLFDASVISRLKERKCVLIAKSSMDELAMGGTGTTSHIGKTYNPYDPSHERMVGGSSSGSAAAMAEGIAAFALGSDTGDSVRKPASYAGLVGMKPSWGRISRYGLFPFAPSLDHVGYFTRDVEGAAYLLEALAGHDDMDSTSSYRPVEAYHEYLDKGIAGKKFCYFKEIVDSLSDEEMKKKFFASLEELKKKGASVEEAAFGLDLLKAIYPAYMVISCAEATSNDANLDGIKFGPHYEGKTYQESMNEARTRGFSELIKRRFVIGSYCLMRENQEELFLRAQRLRHMIVDRLNAILRKYDFVYLPAAPSIAPRFGESSDKLSSEYLIDDNHLALGNFAGLPSITLPLALEKGYPLGVNLMGRAFEEGELFAAAKALEDITGLSGLSAINKKEGRL